jgi:CRISPR-associated endonuclease Csn1
MLIFGDNLGEEPMKFLANRTFGFDIGIASCGWAVIDDGEQIVDMGVWLFDAPETDKERTPTNQLRRTARGMRRVLRRRRQRMRDIRVLFEKHGLLATRVPDAFATLRLDPWKLRAEGLKRMLSMPELAVALAHIAKHRGFKSNSKRDRGANAPKDTKGMLGALEATKSKLANFETVGEMLARDPEFALRKRNRDGDYSRSVERDALAREVALLFDRQRRFKNSAATGDLEKAYVAIAFHQRGLADSEDRVGFCRFFPDERRAAKRAYSFELFRHMSRLANLRLRTGRIEQTLTADEIRLASADFGANHGLKFAKLRKTLKLGDAERFEGVPLDEEGKREVVSRNGDSASGTYALRQALGAAWNGLLASPEKLDRIAFVLSFRESDDTIRAGLADVGLEPTLLEALMAALARGDFSGFTGAADLSAKACRLLLPHLAQGLDFAKACAAAGLKDPDSRAGSLADLVATGDIGKALSEFRIEARKAIDEIGNPVARKALSESAKQFVALAREYGLPGKIHVELARDVGKSKEERDEIKTGIDKRNAEKDKLRLRFEDQLGRKPRNANDFQRFELWTEQHGFCLYTGDPIPVALLASDDNAIQVDHILPWSRSGDDSFVNKTLCFAKANQEKKGRTPWEWYEATKTPEHWDAFVARVETLRPMKGRKKRNYLLKDASVLETKFRDRNLGDTRFATRAFADILRALYPKKDAARSVFARPGALTDRLRRGWGVQGLKKDDKGERIPDDRHHAIDALIVAATSEATLQALTKAFQAAEALGSPRDFGRLDPPWPDFLAQANAAYDRVFVARAERRRARGEGHAQTIKGVAETPDGPVVYERKAVEKLVAKDLERIPDPERNAALIAALRAWIDDGKKKGTKPVSPKGDPINKVRLSTTDKVAVEVRGGTADRGDIVRVDIFTKPNKRGKDEFYAVPIYPHQVMDPTDWPEPPNRPIKGGADEANWAPIDASYRFAFSLHPLSFVQVLKTEGDKPIEGYLRSLDRSTSAITISNMKSKMLVQKGIGLRTVFALRKFQVDRLGRRFEIKSEQRTWHGEACK